MGKTRPEITQQKAAWEKEWSRIATPKMIEALALLAALPDPQFTLVLERCLDRLRVIDRRLEAELEAGPRAQPSPPRRQGRALRRAFMAGRGVRRARRGFGLMKAYYVSNRNAEKPLGF